MNVNCKISSSRRIKLLFKTLLFAEPWQIWSVEFSITSFPQYKDTSRQNLNVSTKLHPHVYHTMLQEIDEDGNLFLLTVISATIFKTIMSKGNRRLPLLSTQRTTHSSFVEEEFFVVPLVCFSLVLEGDKGLLLNQFCPIILIILIS